MANFFCREHRTALRMRVLSSAFLPGHADGADHRFSWNETTSLSRRTIFWTIAFVDDCIALFRASAFARIVTARRRIERGATGAVTRQWSAADLFFSSWRRCWCGCGDLCLRCCADAGQETRPVYIACLDALRAARTSTRDLLTRHAFLRFAGAHERHGERESKCREARAGALKKTHDEGEITTERKGFRLLRRCSWS